MSSPNGNGNAIALVDVGCLFKRNFEANPNAGAENALREIIRIEERVAHVVLCLDGPPYKRAELFPAYKAQRPEPETTEVYQKRLLYKQLMNRGYPMARVEGAEGDDVVATLARIYGESWPEVWLVGADKDLAQCVTDNVLQLVPKHGERAEHFRGPAEVKEKWEVTPEQMPLFLALWGDKGDNVPGVPGVGPVKAAGLIGEFKTLQGIAEHLATGSGKVWESLRANWEQLVLSLKLTTLDSHLPIDAQALLTRGQPAAPPQGEPEFERNATPMPEAALPGPGYSDDPALDDGSDQPEQEPRRPIIGTDPRAVEFMRQEHEARLARERNADRAAREQQEHERQQERARQPRKAAPEFDSEHPDFPQWGSPGWAPKQGPGPLEAARVHEREAAVTEAKLADMPAGTVKPKVTESEFIPFGQPAAAPAPKPATVALMPPVKAKLKGLALLRAPFEKRQISKLPKGTKDQNNCDPKEKRSCNVCGGWHHPKIIHLDYVGHAALTDRLLEADPEWTWEPMAVDPKGLPLFDANDGLWIKLTVCGVTRLGYGNALKKQGQEPGAREKEVIGDALRNAAMRFGAALDLWHKGDDLHAEDWDADEAWQALGGA
jgi:5'-3' exonuclease